MYKILIVDDETEVRKLIRLHIENSKLLAAEAESGLDAISQLKEQTYDLIILDLMMDQGNGFEVLKYLKEKQLQTLVIVVSAKSELEDKISTLGLGADDYVTKPFSPNELVARVQAQLRRHSSKSHQQSETIKINKLILDRSNSILYFEEKKQILTATECELLLLFMKNVDRVLTKREIYKHIWQHENYDDNNLSVFISRLRKILERTTNQQYIYNIRGVGYRFSEDKL